MTSSSIYYLKWISVTIIFMGAYFLFNTNNFAKIKNDLLLYVRVYSPTCENLSNTNFTDLVQKVKTITRCKDKPARYKFKRKGNYWILYNYVTAKTSYKCEESVTYVTHSDFTFLSNLYPLLERWQGPISIALHAPGTDFIETVQSIAHLRNCVALIRDFVTFHIYFGEVHVPNEILSNKEVEDMPYNCSLRPPYDIANKKETYAAKNKVLYPINLGRNIARLMAETHFHLTSDIELYPTPNLIPEFLKLIASCWELLVKYQPEVFVLPVFEVVEKHEVPPNKTILLTMLQRGSAVPFHHSICPECHSVPRFDQWRKSNDTEGLNIFKVAKRTGKHYHWEPIYIGTNAEPSYDERLSWEGESDKIIQAYTMCLMGYSFLILDNAFLVHKPGIKKAGNPEESKWREKIIENSNKLINDVIVPEINTVYHKRNNYCKL